VTHQMTLAASDGTTEEWGCYCGRRILLRWEPFERLVLEHGDEVVHAGAKGPVRMAAEVKV